MEESIKRLSREEAATRARARRLSGGSYLPKNDLKTLPTYEELIDYIERDPYKIKYPNRSAKFLRNSFQLSFLDHFTTETLNQQQEDTLKQQIAKAQIS